MVNPRVLSIEAVNALVPRLRELMQVQMARREEIEQRLGRLATQLGQVPDSLHVDDSDPPRVRELKGEIVQRVERYQSAWTELETMGAVLKDPRAGLVDFCGRVDGNLVWLCWRYGEDAVSHYHSLDEGFSARKPIEPTLRQRHLN
jgi:hypothetical protein